MTTEYDVAIVSPASVVSPVSVVCPVSVVLRAIKLLKVLGVKVVWNNQDRYVPTREKGREDAEAITRLIVLIEEKFPGQMEYLIDAGRLPPLVGLVSTWLNSNHYAFETTPMEMKPTIDWILNEYRIDVLTAQAIFNFFQNFEGSGISDKDIDSCESSGRN